ncbi:MAG: hypothetical protein M3186_13945, partial [Actinomycetota bacterium]|nr:hypothetical protein [Actinomycetota bacterium]
VITAVCIQNAAMYSEVWTRPKFTVEGAARRGDAVVPSNRETHQDQIGQAAGVALAFRRVTSLWPQHVIAPGTRGNRSTHT